METTETKAGYTANTSKIRLQDERGNNAQEEIDLLELLQVFRHHIIIIIACFAAGLILAGGYTHLFITPQYQACAKLYMVSASSDSIVNLTDLNLGSSLSSDYAELLMTRPVILAVIQELELDETYDYDTLCDMVSISTIGDTRILKITATSTDPQEAADIANCLAEKGIEYLPEVMETTEPNLAEQAIVPTKKSSPNTTKNAVMGGLAGAVLCMAVLVVLFLLDDTLKDETDVEKFLGTMPLSVIPEGHLKASDDKRNRHSKRKDTE